MTDSDQQLVPIAIAPNEISAHMLRHVLETHDIESIVFGGNAKNVLFFSVLAQVQLEVRRCDYEKAREVLEALDKRLNEGCPSECAVCRYDMAGLEDVTVCPECGEANSRIELQKHPFSIAPPPREVNPILARVSGIGCIAGAIVAVVGIVLLSIGLAMGW